MPRPGFSPDAYSRYRKSSCAGRLRAFVGITHVFLDTEIGDPQIKVQPAAMQTGDKSEGPCEPVRT